MKFIWILNKQDNIKVLSFNGGKYQYKDIDIVPNEYLDWVIENYSKTYDLEKLFTAQNAIALKMKRISKDLDLEMEKLKIPTVVLKKISTTEQPKTLNFRRR